jgi:ribonuclease HI
MLVTLYFDGLCEPVNPGGVATYGFAIYQDMRLLKEDKGLAAQPKSLEASNNVAEYTALIKGLEWLVENGFSDVEVKGDSKLVISQMKGEYKVKAKRIRPLHEKARRIAAQFQQVSFHWIPRKENRHADSLSREAYKEYRSGSMKWLL